MYIPVASVTAVFTDKKHIPHKDKIKKTLETLIKGKESIQEPDNTSKRAKEDIVPDEKKHNNKKQLHHLKIRKTILVVLMRRHVNPIIIQVKLMVVQETLLKNIKMR